MDFYKFMKGLVSPFLKFLYRIEVKGVENIPKEGNAIICANHISLLDPIIIAIVVPREVNFMAKKELFENYILKRMLKKLGTFPVDREGFSLSAIKNSLKILKKEEVLGIFPEGTRVRDINSENVKPGISMISTKSKSPIIPIYIESEYKLFKKIKVNIGKPFEFSEYYEKKLSTEDYKKLSIKISDAIYSMNDTSNCA